MTMSLFSSTTLEPLQNHPLRLALWASANQKTQREEAKGA
jgi:hypothetical protein